MIRSYFKIAFRHLKKHTVYAAINVIGLTCGTICILLAILYWNDEHTFDTFHKGNPHLYKITTSVLSKDGVRNTLGTTGQVQGPAFKASVPEVDKYVRVMGGDIYTVLSSPEKNLRLQTFFADSTFFDVFTFNTIKGNPAKALKDIDGIVLTERTARKFFNGTDVLGKTLTMEADPSYERLRKPLVVTGVVQDPPANSSIQFDALLSFAFMRLSFEDNSWQNAYLGTFVQLHPQADVGYVTRKFNDIYAAQGRKQVGNADYDFRGYDPKIEYGLQSMTDIHLNNGLVTRESNEAGVVNSSNRFIPLHLWVSRCSSCSWLSPILSISVWAPQ
jgi:putative ABC transport system permease protein